MKYVWAAVIALAVVGLAAGGIIGVHRWVAAKKLKIALDVIIPLVLAVMGLASQTFIGVLQIFPSSASPSATPLSSGLCPSQEVGALLQLWPAALKTASRVTIAGDGFQPNAVIEISAYGQRPALNGKLDDIGSTRSDACGKFNYSWNIPSSLETSGYASVKILAIDQNQSSGNCCRASATLALDT